jgi:calcium-dependent protein kinase
MGSGGAKASSKSSEDLEGVRKRAEERLGKVAITGRYHTGKKLQDDYKVNESDVVGSGYNGAVYKASSKEDTSKRVAVKDFKLKGVDAEKLEELKVECEIFLGMDHPHVARLTDVYEDEDNNKLSLVMELMEGGELFDRVIERKKYTEKDAADAAYQMLLAVAYIHSHGICHRDIKLENFLYEKKESDHLKLIDFGFSKIWDPSTKMKLSCGTLSYVAPEVLSKSYTNKCDMWSIGVVCFILLTGYMPFSGGEETQVKNIRAGKFTKKEAYNRLSKEADDFLRNLICVEAKDRLDAEAALEHPFIKGRSERAATELEVSEDSLKNLIDFSKASKFRRACMTAMAWSLSNDQRMELRNAFLAMDKNHTGTITMGEFKTIIAEKHAGEFTDSQVKEIFDAVDTAHSEEIAYTEFLAAMMMNRFALHEDLLKATFRRFDADGSGIIEAKDLKTLLGETFEGEKVEDLVKEADTNGDGKISYDEFLAFAKKNAASDSDHKSVDVAQQLIDQEAAKLKK